MAVSRVVVVVKLKSARFGDGCQHHGQRWIVHILALIASIQASLFFALFLCLPTQLVHDYMLAWRSPFFVP